MDLRDASASKKLSCDKEDTHRSPVSFSWQLPVHHRGRVGSKFGIPAWRISLFLYLLECVEVDEGVTDSVSENQLL